MVSGMLMTKDLTLDMDSMEYLMPCAPMPESLNPAKGKWSGPLLRCCCFFWGGGVE